MKYIWEEKDINAGRYICRESWPEDSDDIGGLCSVTFKMGFITGASVCMCLVAITDGMVSHYPQYGDKANAITRLVEHLNSDKYGYRPLTHKQVMRRMEYLESINENGN